MVTSITNYTMSDTQHYWDIDNGCVLVDAYEVLAWRGADVEDVEVVAYFRSLALAAKFTNAMNNTLKDPNQLELGV